jgi:hypothetical protein
MSETTELRPILKAFAKRAGDYIAEADEPAPEKCRGWWCGYSAPEKAAHAAHTAATLAELVIMGIEAEEAGVADKLDRIAGTLVLLRHAISPLVEGDNPDPHALAEAFAGEIEANLLLGTSRLPQAAVVDLLAATVTTLQRVTDRHKSAACANLAGLECIRAYKSFGILEDA